MVARHFTFALSLLLVLLPLGCNSGKRDRRSNATSPVTTGTVTSGTTNNNLTQIAASVAVLNSAQARPGTVVAMHLRVSAPTRAVELESLTFSASGTVDETQLGALALIGDDNRDGVADPSEPTLASVPSAAFTVDDGSVTATLSSAVTIGFGATLDLLVTLETPAAGQAALALVGETIQLSVVDAIDVVANDQGQPVTAVGNFPLDGGAVTLFVHDHLLLTEIVRTPTAGEYVEIYNPTAAAVDLSDVYLTDATDQNSATWYYNLPTGTGLAVQDSDWFVRFPAGSQLASGEAITIAISGTGFETTYGQPADYCLKDLSGGAVQMLTPDGQVPPSWVSAPPTSAYPGLTNNGEPVVLFQWDGQSDLVQDLDYVFYGSASASNQRIDKTNVSIDGPDADTTPSDYLPETPAYLQTAILPAYAPDNAIQRVDFGELGETTSGGNGTGGHDETSEPFDVTFLNGPPTPGSP